VTEDDDHVEDMSEQDWVEYFELCGWGWHGRTLGREMQRGLRVTWGKNGTVRSAIAKFAVNYADQTERDHAVLARAIRRGAFLLAQAWEF